VRFDPDTRKLRISLNPPQSRPFTLIVRSQVAAGPLPFEQSVGLLSVNNAASQLGPSASPPAPKCSSTILPRTRFLPNLEDFPADAASTVARANRRADAAPRLSLRGRERNRRVEASLVEPDVRVETQETLSLGEDRTLLAANVALTITRAGLFRVSFALPGGLDVESVSGAALSHGRS